MTLHDISSRCWRTLPTRHNDSKHGLQGSSRGRGQSHRRRRRGSLINGADTPHGLLILHKQAGNPVQSFVHSTGRNHALSIAQQPRSKHIASSWISGVTRCRRHQDCHTSRRTPKHSGKRLKAKPLLISSKKASTNSVGVAVEQGFHRVIQQVHWRLEGLGQNLMPFKKSAASQAQTKDKR